MKIGKLISMFVVGCLFALSLARGANVNAQTGGVYPVAQTGGANPMRTNQMQQSNQGMSKKKHGKHHHKKSHHQG